MASIPLRKPVFKYRHSFLTTNVGSAAWVEIVSSLSQPASEVEFYNSSSKIIKLSTGIVGSEDASELKYYILPFGHAIIVQQGFSKTARISAKTVEGTANEGDLVFNFFG